MKVLTVTNIYPTAKRPFVSTFVKEQVESMRRNFPDLAIDVHIIKGRRPKGEYLREMLRLPAAVRKGNYDIVHAHYGLTLISLLLVRVPVVVTFAGSDLLLSPTKYVSRILLHRASRVIVVAQRLKEVLGHGELIPYGIPVKNFLLPEQTGKQPCPKPPGELKVLFPSDPARKVKDYALFSSVCAELEKRGNRVREIHLTNIANSQDVPEIYWNCDIMLLTSLSEGSPTVIKEAIAAKLPFVSVEVGDVKEWARLVEFGVVVPDRNPKTIADAVIALLGRTECRALLDNSSCLEAMDLANVAGRVRRVYDEVLEKRL